MSTTGGNAPPEIWAYGSRNPWKLTFDPASGEAIVVDVGADRWEEVHRVVPGGDHGWPAREGRECVLHGDGSLLDPGCDAREDVAPWFTYGHLDLDPDADRREILADAGPGVSAVDEDPAGEVLIGTLDGTAPRLVRDR